MNDAAILRELPRLSALIVGDICLDHWCRYQPGLALASAETGIPRVAVVQTTLTAGAGGTVANNLASLGVGRVSVLGIIGDDGHGFELRRALTRAGVSDQLLIEAPGHQTFTYTKLINDVTGREDLPRVDFLFDPAPDAERILLDQLLVAVDAHDLILISDQAETDHAGVVTEPVRKLLSELAPVYRDKVFLADSRRRAHLFRNILLKANHAEAKEAAQSDDFETLRAKTHSPALFVTQGGDGVRIFEPHAESFVAVAKIENPVDVCGAGDSFAAGATAAFFLTGSAVRAAEFGSRVAQITIGKPGTGTATPAEVLALA
jgi:rfaE bifunctional protein kinase chain/domain